VKLRVCRPSSLPSLVATSWMEYWPVLRLTSAVSYMPVRAWRIEAVGRDLSGLAGGVDGDGEEALE